MAVAVLCDLGLEVNIKVWNVLLDQGVQLEGEDVMMIMMNHHC